MYAVILGSAGLMEGVLNANIRQTVRQQHDDVGGRWAIAIGNGKHTLTHNPENEPIYFKIKDITAKEGIKCFIEQRLLR